LVPNQNVQARRDEDMDKIFDLPRDLQTMISEH
jgi:hypothetical protein